MKANRKTSEKKPLATSRPIEPPLLAKIALSLLALSLLVLISACSKPNYNRPEMAPLPTSKIADPPGGAALLDVNTHTGDVIANMLLQRMGGGSGLLATSFVRLDTLDDTTSFGRLVSQQVGSRIAQHGFMVLDVRLTNNLVINQNGEFMLSRDLGRLLARDYNAHAVLVGTYTPASDKLYVSVRVLRLVDSAVIAAYEYYLPLGPDVSTLLGPGVTGSDAVWEAYSRRGRAFSGGSSVCPPTAGTVETRRVPARAAYEKDAPAPDWDSLPIAPQGAAPGPLGVEYVSPALPQQSLLPEYIEPRGGGRRVSP